MYARSSSNYLKKCLTFILIFGSLIVLLIIFYLENSVKVNNAQSEILLFNEAWIQEDEKLLNLTNFRYVIKNDVCGEPFRKNTLAILIVTSYAGDVETRSAIRRSFPAKTLLKFGVRRVFLLALIDEKKNYNQVSQAAIEDENRRFGDIIQGNFIEDYRNLTYKHIMGLQWASNHCQQAKDKYLLAGYVMTHMKPIRESTNKWYVSMKEYSRSNYPNFLSDDLFVTGLLVEKTNISLFKLNRFYTTHHEYLKCCIDKPGYACDYLIGPLGNDNKLFFKFQKYAENCFYKNCKKRKEENSVKNTCIATWKENPFGKGHALIDPVKLR
ncbi:beta-1,3-galactosyltransferase, putative [Pediculus humanus corporis]|uniref:Hexosyltransferase n=1 Tax=Pediculus humanus subsp. corporis TaxID=121224 RepID=E0VL89_PEDHC|nr:beta-1,3-galactosyltransferase, putative [Pediculus humanus corporis]EEB14145.1 beta-1,3-galactosyltransferase, putative [Pediculus humanus corporis]